VKTALVIGCLGQDGSYISEQLRERGYGVWGIDSDYAHSVSGGSLDPVNILVHQEVRSLLAESIPDEIYYLAAYHHSSESSTGDDHHLLKRSLEVNSIGLLNVLDSAMSCVPCSRIFYAASSHIFGDPPTAFQDEKTPFAPICAYGISKTVGIHICRYYRQSRGLFCSVGIMYNHESPRRPSTFVSKKITSGAINIMKGMQQEIRLGNISSQVDWGYAPDYTNAMQRIMGLDHPDEFVIATGILHTPQDWLEAVFGYLGLDYRKYIKVDGALMKKQTRQNPLRGNSEKLWRASTWKPTMDFRRLAEIMVEEELRRDNIE